MKYDLAHLTMVHEVC